MDPLAAVVAGVAKKAISLHAVRIGTPENCSP
jgi:hypothetical protein